MAQSGEIKCDTCGLVAPVYQLGGLSHVWCLKATCKGLMTRGAQLVQRKLFPCPT